MGFVVEVSRRVTIEAVACGWPNLMAACASSLHANTPESFRQPPRARLRRLAREFRIHLAASTNLRSGRQVPRHRQPTRMGSTRRRAVRTGHVTVRVAARMGLLRHQAKLGRLRAFLVDERQDSIAVNL